MAIASTPFDNIAESLVARAADLLSAPVLVIDDRGYVVASNEAQRVGLPYDPAVERSSYLRVPLRLDSGAGEVVVAQPHGDEPVSPRLARVLVELMISQAAVVDRLPNKNELKNKLIHDLLHGSIRDEATILREAQILGMDLAPPRAVILIDASAYILARGPHGGEAPDSRMRRRSQMVIGSVVDFFELPNDTICAYIGNGEVAVLKASNRQNLVPWVDRNRELDQASPSWANLSALKRAGSALRTRLKTDTGADISLGIGRYHPGLRGLARSYADAQIALSLGRQFHGRNGVHCLDNLGIAAFVGVADERTKVELASHLLSPLDHEPELIETIEVFFAADCCPSDTARRLSIHRNTLGYRLDKIASLTGLDPRTFDDAVQIRLALALRRLEPAGHCASAQSEP